MNNRERIIDLKALCRGILGRWRLLLILALAAALILGGMEGYTQYRAYQKSLTAADTEPENAEATGTSKSEELRMISEILEKRNDYFTGSILSRIDPAQEGFASADMIVRFPQDAVVPEGLDLTEAGADGAATGSAGNAQAAGTTAEAGTAAGTGTEAGAGTDTGAGTAAGKAAAANTSDSIGLSLSLNAMSYYTAAATMRSDLTGAAQALGEDPASLRELITVTDSNKTDYMVTIKVVYPTQDGARQILDSLITQIQDSHAQAEEIYGPHTLQIANVNSAVIVDTSMLKWANTRLTEINALANSRKTLDKNISGGTTSPGTEQISKRKMAAAVAGKGAAGLLAGLIGGMILIALWLLVRGKVLSGRELNRQFGLYRIACVPARKYENLKGIDRLAASIDAGYYNSTKRGVCMQVADANMRGIMRGSAQVALIGDLPAEAMDKVAAELNKAGKANGSGMRYFAVSGSEQTPETVRTLDSCDIAVLVARAGTSSYKGAADVLDMADLLDRKAAGSIVFM